jgi:hypothetical protein
VIGEVGVGRGQQDSIDSLGREAVEQALLEISIGRGITDQYRVVLALSFFLRTPQHFGKE